MNDVSLLSDKFVLAALPAICAPRAALMKKFDEAAVKRILYVAAPSGFGKTLSTRLWLNNSKRRHVFISLDEYDNTTTVFYRQLCTGILSLQPDNQAMAEILANPHFNTSPVNGTIELISSFLPDGRQYAFVIDNMQYITNKEILKSIRIVQKRLPGSFLLMILTTEKIRPETIEAFGPDRCSVLTSADLAFTTGEIQKYYYEYGYSITMADAAAVHSVTGGWAIGISALAMNGMTKLEPGNGQIFAPYIKSQIWYKWGEERQNFLIRTSIVNGITAELADRLTGRNDSREVLEEMCIHNFFISFDGKETFYYHQLFLEFLQEMRSQADEVLIRNLYVIAAEYYLEKNMVFQARQCALKSQDSNSIQVTTYAVGDMAKPGYDFSVDDFVNVYRGLCKDMLPEEACLSYPYLYSQFAGYYFVIGDAPMTEHCLDQVYHYLPDIAQNYPQFVSDTVLMTFFDYRVSLADMVGRLLQYQAKCDLNGRMQWSTITLHLPFFYRSGRDFCELAGGMLDQLAGILVPMLGSNGRVMPALLQAGFLYEQNQLAESLKYAGEAATLEANDTNSELAFCQWMQKAAGAAAMANEALLEITMTQLEEFVNRTENSHFKPNFEAFRSRLALSEGTQAAAKAWLEYYYTVETGPLELYKIYRYFTTARAYIVLGWTDQAREYLLRVRRLGEAFLRPLDIAEADVLCAVLEWALGQKKKAMKMLETALISMQTYGFIRIIADEGAAVLPILKRLMTAAGKGKEQSQIDHHFLNQVIFAAHEQAMHRKGIAIHVQSPKIKLSKQQRQMLTLLAKGYKNAEIAAATGLTIHTVKFHLSAAYKKLSVDNAIDAVIKAHEQGQI